MNFLQKGGNKDLLLVIFESKMKKKIKYIYSILNIIIKKLIKKKKKIIYIYFYN
jgi:hypothetical protein